MVLFGKVSGVLCCSSIFAWDRDFTDFPKLKIEGAKVGKYTA
jgi:hypothetical protein